MTFKRGGLIFNPEGVFDWAESYALQPTPFLTKEGIKVYCGFRDIDGVSRIGYVLLDKDDPCKILRYSKRPVLDIGEDGHFDDNGVVPCYVFEQEGRIYMHYAGYQLVKKIKFQVFGGVSVSDDGGESFKRVLKVPFTDRTSVEPFFRVVHSMIEIDGKYIFFYGGGDSFINLSGKTFPSYNIRSFVSDSFMESNDVSRVILDFASEDEYRVARPFAYKDGQIYFMLFYSAKRNGSFTIERARSSDGYLWERDKAFKIKGESENWDCKMMAYPSFIRTEKYEYIFYNGNDYGRDGFGYLFRERK